ncbi:MAG TPA: hypothetical protein VHJ78_03310 [Actinomycetota bacterium]|nr:hypothetical protein [Actinomycetota bacterium]
MPESAVGQFLAAARRRPSLTIFLLGFLLFAGGLVSVIGNQITKAAGELPQPRGTTSAAAAARVGPKLGEAVDPYIQKKTSTVTERARSNPGDPTLALVVFKEYRTAGQVESFLRARRLDALAAQVRVPVRSFEPQEVQLEGRSLADAAGGMRRTVSRELEILEGVAASVKDPAYRAVYEKDVDLYREALAKLTAEPATIFAVVVRSTHSNLASANRSPEVRYVDVPDDPTATLQDTTFAAIVPEDSQTATFAVQ